MNARSRITIVAIMTLAMLGFAVWRTLGIRTAEHRATEQWKRERASLIDHAQAQYRSIADRPVSELQTLEDWKALLNTATVMPGGSGDGREESGQTSSEGIPDLPDTAMRDLLSHVSELLYYRFGQDSAEEYIAWRRHNGYTLRPREELVGRWFIDEDYEWMFGRPMPADVSIEQIFSEMWSESPKSFSNSQRLAWVPSDTAGMGVVVALGRSTEPSANPSAPALPADDLVPWYGPANGTLRNWWVGSRTYRDLALANLQAGVPVATVGVVAGFESGDYRALHVICYFDRDSGRWYVHGMQQYNFRGSTVSALEL